MRIQKVLWIHSDIGYCACYNIIPISDYLNINNYVDAVTIILGFNSNITYIIIIHQPLSKHI